MGSSRSWAADMEDEIVVCKYGKESKYFDDCKCDGCKVDRAHREAADAMSWRVKSIALEFFDKLPRDQWDKVVSIRIK